MEGEKLVLVCLVAGGTGDITFFWYKGALGLNLETKTQRSLTAKFEIPTVRESDAEQYYCAADNGYGPSLSGLVSITVRSKFHYASAQPAGCRLGSMLPWGTLRKFTGAEPLWVAIMNLSHNQRPSLTVYYLCQFQCLVLSSPSGLLGPRLW